AQKQSMAMGYMMMAGGMGGGMGMNPMMGGMGANPMMGGMGGNNPMMQNMMLAQGLKCQATGQETQDFAECVKIVNTYDGFLMRELDFKQAGQYAVDQQQAEGQLAVVNARGEDPTIQLKALQDSVQTNAGVAFSRATLQLSKAGAFAGI